MNDTLIQLAIVLSLASVSGFIVFKLKLPLVIAYLLSGVLLSLFNLFNVSDSYIFHVLPEIGIAFVLFLIGMELDLRELKTLGAPIVIASLGQITISTLIGYLVAVMLGFGNTESIYMGLGLAFSSTVVVIKMLLEKKDINSLYGKLSIGILLVEDLVAVAVLMLASVGSSALNLGIQGSLPLLAVVLKATGLFLLTFVLSKYVLQKIFEAVANSTELLFFTSITWCFVFTAVAVLSGFSVVIGAFLAGVAIATSPYHLHIQGKIKPLRDFFLTLFFVYLGSQVKVEYLTDSLPAIIAFLLLAIFVKPVIYLLLISNFGFKKHTLFQTALNLSQISEFSLIVLLVAAQYGLASDKALTVMSAVGVVSIIVSSLFISSSKKIYKSLGTYLSPFEKKSSRFHIESRAEVDMTDHVVLIGAHRAGGPVVKYLSKAGVPFIVMDFNPTIVKKLRDSGVNVIYGDIGDPEVLDNLKLEKAKLIISTASDTMDNEILLEECSRRKIQATILVRSEDIANNERLKKLGANYIITPENLFGIFIADQIKRHWPKTHFTGLKRNILSK